MNHKSIGGTFAVLYLLCVLPSPFTKKAPVYLLGWLPSPLVYWWILMVANLLFVLWVYRCSVNPSKKRGEEEE